MYITEVMAFEMSHQHGRV